MAAQPEPEQLHHIIPLHDYLILLNMPGGTYGLSYDISTLNTERDLPYGWNAWRSQTYHQLAKRLEQGHFTRKQKSDWARDGTIAMQAYYTMLMLRNIPPVGKLQTTVQGLKMHHIDNWVFDITDGVTIGGIYAGHLEGPTPRELVPPDVPAVQPPIGYPLPPRHTGCSNAALNRDNWRINPDAQ